MDRRQVKYPLFFLLAALMATAGSCSASGQAGQQNTLERRVVVQFKDAVSQAVLDEEIKFIEEQYSVKEIRKFYKGSASAEISRIYVLVFNESSGDLNKICEELAQREAVQYAEPEGIARTHE